MRKITFYFTITLLTLFIWQTNAQINIYEDFENGLPDNWSMIGGVYQNNNTDYVCEGASSMYDNIFDNSDNNGVMTSNNYVGVSNGEDVVVIYQWAARPYQTNAVDYTIDVEYSIDDGASWISISQYYVTEEMPCTTYSETIDGANLPVGSDFKFRIRATWISGDSYHYIDDLSIVQNQSSASVLNELVDEFTMYPNPVKNTLNIHSDNKITKITIYNLFGQIVKREQLNDKDLNLSVDSLSSGTYLIKINTEKGIGYNKLIKK